MNGPASGSERLSLPMKALLASAGGLAVVAGPIQFFFPHDTETYFAWTIRHPLTPAYGLASAAFLRTARRSAAVVTR